MPITPARFATPPDTRPVSNPIHLDYNATTPVAPEVADAIEPFLRTGFGNPSSDHVYGRQARQAVDRARSQVAILLGADVSEVVFTGCATEANNLAIFGVTRALRETSRAASCCSSSMDLRRTRACAFGSIASRLYGCGSQVAATLFGWAGIDREHPADTA